MGPSSTVPKLSPFRRIFRRRRAIRKIGSNGGGDRSDDDAENSTNQRDNYGEEFDPFRIEKLLLYDSDDELTEHHAGADGAITQLTNMKQEARK